MHWSLAHMILDLAQNSIEAGSSLVELSVAARGSIWHVEIRDNGCGMDDAQKASALDPFYTEPGKHPGRRVGLGLPFLLQTVEQADGGYSLHSEKGRGTRLSFFLDSAHVDSPPLGDLAELFVDLMCYQGDYELIIQRSCAPAASAEGEGQGDQEIRSYELSRSELEETLGEIALVENRLLARELLLDWEASLREV
ncbi:ATP-binding protein [Alkalispirochaeta sphaeroplastigenens]|nr:ATP-binding protein [Alkalispirochaeta sphaeroplastigenens]